MLARTLTNILLGAGISSAWWGWSLFGGSKSLPPLVIMSFLFFVYLGILFEKEWK